MPNPDRYAWKQHRPRLLSLDILRGLTVIGMVLANSSAHLKNEIGLNVFLGCCTRAGTG